MGAAQHPIGSVFGTWPNLEKQFCINRYIHLWTQRVLFFVGTRIPEPTQKHRGNPSYICKKRRILPFICSKTQNVMDNCCRILLHKMSFLSPHQQY